MSSPEFKEINHSNWQSADEQTSLWMQMTAAVKSQGEWLDFFSNPVLSPTVPKELMSLLEVARGAMIYGWYFYPLATLGAEQCWRVLESGVRLRCQQAGIETKISESNGWERATSFEANIRALLQFNLTPDQDKRRWDAIRSLRNSTSHPQHQMILDPGQAQGILKLTVDTLNDLFQ